MLFSSNLMRVFAIIFGLAAPAVAIYILSTFFDTPYLRPLALTRESVAAAGAQNEGERHVRIDVKIDWGRDWPGLATQQSLRDTLSKTLDHHTKFYHFEFEDVEGESIDITFLVGHNTYGPFPQVR